MFKRVAIIGTGLMGGSLAAALRARCHAAQRVGYGQEPDISRAMILGLFDERAESLGQAVSGADLVVLAAPVSVNCLLMKDVVSFLTADAVLTDLSSVKWPVEQAVRGCADGAVLAGFTASHPVAGDDRAGPDAARPDLFDGREVVLCPLSETATRTMLRLQQFWQMLGARVTRMSASEHDRVFALVSHAPHAVAFAVAGAVAEDGRHGADENAVRAGDHAGPGLLDLTRIAGSDPALWTDILLQNQQPALQAVDAVLDRLGAIRQALQAGEHDALMALLQIGAQWRRTRG